MRNFGEMVDETLSYLRSYVRDQEQSTHLVDPVTVDATMLVVADGGLVTRGRIEVNEELMWVDRVDRASGQVSLSPWGRGVDSTTRSTHTAGSRVTVQPLYPRKVVRDRLNDAIRQVGSTLYGIEEVSFAGDPTTFVYQLPPFTREVLGVRVSETHGGLVETEPLWLRRWTFDKRAPESVVASRKALYLRDRTLTPVERLTVVISRDPAALFFNTQMFSETFLPASAWDVPVLFAAARMLATADAASLQTRAVEAGSMGGGGQSNPGVNYSKYLLGLAQTRLEEERQRLLTETVQRPHYSR